MFKLDSLSEYLIAAYLAAGGSVNKVREWFKEAENTPRVEDVIKESER
jgi:hypothetical protein